jgi:Fibronectin type III domain
MLSRALVLTSAIAAFALLGAGPAFGADRKAPSVPPGLAKTGANSTSINFSWNAATDNVAVTSYRIYRNGTFLTSLSASARSHSLTGLKCGTKYIVAVAARDAAGNMSLPAVILPSTESCAPPCPTPSTVFQLLLEHRLTYGCDWPLGGGAQQAISSVRNFMTLRLAMLDDPRAKRWYGVVLSEIDAATGNTGAWTSSGALRNNATGAVVINKLLRVVRILHFHNSELFQATKAEKWAFTAVIWYITASDYNGRLKAGQSAASLARTLQDIKAAESEFFSANAYGAAGRYVRAFQRMGGTL